MLALRARRAACALMLGALGCVASAAALAADRVYRWQDAQGNTVFSQRPPADRSAEVVKPLTAKAAPDGGKQLEAARKVFAPPTPQDKPAPKAPTPGEQAKLAAGCRQAQDAVQLLQANNRPRYVDESGRAAIMSEAIKASRLADAEKKVAEYCR